MYHQECPYYPGANSNSLPTIVPRKLSWFILMASNAHGVSYNSEFVVQDGEYIPLYSASNLLPKRY